MESIDDLLAYNVMTLRHKLGMTQEELAEKCNLSLRMIQKVEYRKTWPRPKSLACIAKALKTTPSALLAERTPKPTPTMESLLKAIEEITLEFPTEFREAWAKLSPAQRKVAMKGITEISRHNHKKKDVS